MHAFTRFFSGPAGRRDGGGLWSLIRGCCLALPLLFVGGLSQAQTFSDGFAQGAGGTTGISNTTTDAAGNSYSAGTFTSVGGALSGGGMTLTPVGTQDGYVAKFNASGAVIWAHNFGGANVSVVTDGLALDPSGNLYVAASFYGGNMTAPAVTKISTTNYQNLADGLLMKFDTNGNLLWVRNFGGTTASVQQNNLAVDSTGSLVAVGHFSVGSMTAPYLAHMSNLGFDAYAIKVDTNGNLQWAQEYGSTAATTTADAVAIDSANNVYLAGQLRSGSMNSPALTPIGAADSYVIKLNSSGATQWAHNYGGPGVTSDVGSAAIDSAGNLAISGYFLKGGFTTPYQPMVSTADGGEAFVFKISSAGSVMWSHAFGGGGTGSSSDGVFADNAGNIVMTGTMYGGSMTYPALTATGLWDVFAVEMNSAGVPTWVLNVGAANDNVQASSTGGYFANGTRYILLGGDIHYGTTPGWNAFLLKTPIQ